MAKRIMHKNHFKRERAINEKIIDYIDYTPISDRDKEIFIAYVNGCNYKELTEKYGLSKQRISDIVSISINKTIWYNKIYKKALKNGEIN